MEALTKYIEREKCTQAALAARIGVSHSMLSRMLKGDRFPSIKLTKRIEQVTGIPRHALRPDVYEAAQ